MTPAELTTVGAAGATMIEAASMPATGSVDFVAFLGFIFSGLYVVN
jgi:hypothetical protein